MSDIRENTYLTSLSRVPLFPVEYADSAYVVFMSLLNQPVPPKYVSMVVGGGGKVEPLCDESGIADGWK